MQTLLRIGRSPRGGFRASCPSLPGCIADGRSPQEATRKMADAVSGYLVSMNVAVSGKGPDLKVQMT